MGLPGERENNDQRACGRRITLKKQSLWSLHSWFESMSGSIWKSITCHERAVQCAQDSCGRKQFRGQACRHDASRKRASTTTSLSPAACDLIALICTPSLGRAGGESLPRPPSEIVQISAASPTRLASTAHSFRRRLVAPTPGFGRNESGGLIPAFPATSPTHERHLWGSSPRGYGLQPASIRLVMASESLGSVIFAHPLRHTAATLLLNERGEPPARRAGPP